MKKISYILSSLLIFLLISCNGIFAATPQIPSNITFVTSNNNSQEQANTILLQNNTATLLGKCTFNDGWRLTGENINYPINNTDTTQSFNIRNINLNGFGISMDNSDIDNPDNLPTLLSINTSSTIDYQIYGNSQSNNSSTNYISLSGDNNGAAISCSSGNLTLNNVYVSSSTNPADASPGTLSIGASTSQTVNSVVTLKNNCNITSSENYGISVFGTTGFTPTLNVENGTVHGGTGAIGTNASPETLKGKPNIIIGTVGSTTGPEITGGTCGLFLTDADAQVTVNSGSISGLSGVFIRGGQLNVNGGTITGTGSANYVGPSATETSKVGSNGSGILIVGANDTTGNSYGKVDININGGVIQGQQNSGVTQVNCSESSQNPLTGLDITGGTISGGGGNPGLQENMQTSTGSPDSPGVVVSAGSISEPVDDNYIPNSVKNKAEVTTSGGQTFNVYGPNQSSVTNSINQLNKFLVENNEEITGESFSPVFNGGSLDEPVSTQSGNNYILNVSMNGEFTTFIKSSSAASSNNSQEESLGLQINSVGTVKYAANALDWTVTPISGNASGVPTFNNNEWKWLDYPRGTTALQLKSDDGAWTLVQQAKYNNPSTGSNVPTITSFGNSYLLYNGGGNIQPGIYELTCTVPTGLYQGSTAPSDSLRFNVVQSNISSVTVTQDGRTAPAYQTINMQTTPTVQLGYSTNPASAYPGSSVNWELSAIPATTNVAQYASINPTTGLIRFRAPTPPGTVLYANVTVDGVQSNTIALTVTGEPVSTDITEMAFVPDTVNVLNSQSFDLMSNLYIMPDYVPVNENMLEDIQFTTDSNNVIIYNGTILPINTNFTGTAEVTAVYTNEDGTKSEPTTLTVNFVSREVPATGIAAKESLTFSLTDDQSQNVGVYLTPETNTEVPPALDDFIYTSANQNIATVDEYGNVYPVSVGTTTITTSYDGDLENPAPNTEPVDTVTTTVTITETPSDVPATSITANPTDVYLAPSTVAEADHSQTITVTTEPENTTDEVTYTVSPQSVATVTDNGDGTYTVTAQAEGRATITFTAGSVSATVDVIVSAQPVVAESITASGTTPDDFTVTVNNVGPNPAIHATGANVNHVSIFTWSGPNQNDIQCVAVPNNGTTTYTYSPFEVNGNRPNTWYYNADNIYVQCYANVGGSDYYLGAVSPNYSWMDAADTAGHNVAYITYQENIGFVEPTVFDGNQSGLTGRHLQLEGLRVSSCIEGVDVVTEVHAQNIGWSATRS